MISDDRLQKALTYLATTDESAARARALMEGLSDQRKTVKAIGFLDASGTRDERESSAYVSSEYREHGKRYEDAVFEYEALRNKRSTEALIVEVWRSEQANRRAGNV